MPVRSGMRRSRMAASKVDFSMTFRADLPSGQTVTSWPRRGSSERMNSCSDSSSSTKRTRRHLCGGVANSFLRLFGRMPRPAAPSDREDVGPAQRLGLRARAFLDLGRLDRHTNCEGTSLVRTSAGGQDRATMLIDDLMANEQAEPRPLACPATREERLEDVVQYVGGHPAAGVHEQQLGQWAALLQRDR